MTAQEPVAKEALDGKGQRSFATLSLKDRQVFFFFLLFMLILLKLNFERKYLTINILYIVKPH